MSDINKEELNDAGQRQEKPIISEYFAFEAPSKEFITEQQKENKPIIMKGILQKADTVNRNGRVYPYEILKREADKYMKLVQENEAGGEQDHPDCLTSDAMILTKSGWKKIEEISENEKIVTLNEKGEIEIQEIDKKIDQPYAGSMYHFKGQNIDIITTPNHRFLLETSDGVKFYKTAEELFNHRSNKWRIPKKGKWEGNDYKKIKIAGSAVNSRLKNILKEKYSSDIEIDAEVWFEFMGWYLSEGSTIGVTSSLLKSNKVKIIQTKENTKKEIRNLLLKMPFELHEYEAENGKVDFVFNDARLKNYLLPLGNSGQKYIPEEIKNASPRLLQILFDAFMKGDGRNVKQGKNSFKKSVFSTSKRLIHDLQEILLKIGGSGNISEWQPKDRNIYDIKESFQEFENSDGTLELVKTRTRTARTIKAESSRLQYNLNVSSTDFIYLDKRFLKIEKIDFDDRVYCVRVKNGNFYTMRNGKSHWTGNSSVVSLSNISHRVIDMWWEGKELHGKVLVAEETTAGKNIIGLLKAGFKLGISSRGLGSVKKINGQDVVQDDFELVAFDFVSSPSTPGAYLFRESNKMSAIKMEEENIHVFEDNLTDKYREVRKIFERKFWKF